MSAAEAVTDATFAQSVLKSAIPVVVDYWADWCAPCKQLAPILDELAGEYAGRIKFVKVDTNDNPVTPATYGVLKLPTIQVFVGGEPVNVIPGAVTKMKLRRVLDEVA